MSRNKIIASVIVFSIVGFLLQSNAPIGSMLWPPHPDLPTPNAVQLALLMGYGVLASVGFGVGVTFLAFGRPLFDNLRISAGMATAMHLAVSWLLLNWIIHDSLHQSVGFNLNGLAALEWGFHGTLLLGGVALGSGLLQHARAPEAPPARVKPVATSETV